MSEEGPAAVPPKAAVGWHFHRWTAWEDDRLITTWLTGMRLATQVQTRRCAKCRKVKVRRVR